MYYYKSLHIIQISKMNSRSHFRSTSRYQVDRSEQTHARKTAAFEEIKGLIDSKYFGRQDIEHQLALARDNLKSNKWQQMIEKQHLNIFKKRQAILNEFRLSQTKKSSHQQDFSSQQKSQEDYRQNRVLQISENHEQHELARLGSTQDWVLNFINHFELQQKAKSTTKYSTELTNSQFNHLKNVFFRLKSEKQEAIREIQKLKHEKQEAMREKQAILYEKQEFKREKQELNQKNKALQLKFSQMKDQNTSLSHQYSSVLQKNKKYQEAYDINLRLQNEKNRLLQQNRQLKDKNIQLNEKANVFKQLYDQEKVELVDVRAQFTKSCFANVNLVQQNNTLKKDIQSLTITIREQKQEAQQLKNEAQQLKTKFQKQNDEKRNLRHQMGLQLLSYQQRLQRSLEQIIVMQRKLAQKQDQIRKLNQDLLEQGWARFE